MFRTWRLGRETSKEKKNLKFTFISEEINAWNTFWNINKITILCSETPFSKNSYCTEISQMICNAKHLAGFQTVHVFSDRHSKQTLTYFKPMLYLNQPGSWFLLAKCLKNHLWKSDMIIKDTSHLPVSYLKCHSTTTIF